MRVKSGEKFLDVGTCVGQELRALANDGAPTENLYGTGELIFSSLLRHGLLNLTPWIFIADITDAYWPLSFELFNDRATFKATFIQSDIFDHSSELATKLAGSCDIIYLGLLLHLFSYDLQVEASCRIVELSKGSGSIIVGKSGGWDKAGVQKRALTIQNEGKNNQPERFRHDKDSFTKMWEEVSHRTKTEWIVEIDIEKDELTWRHQMDDLKGRQPEWLFFTMRRVE